MKILVTGGGGFLGQALCRGLRARGYEVVSFNRGRYDALDAIGVTQVQGDLAQRDAIVAAARGCDAVFHNAAKAGAWGSYESYHAANVVGTDNVIAACRAHGIGRLVYTSTPSVTHRAHPSGRRRHRPERALRRALQGAVRGDQADRRTRRARRQRHRRWPRSPCARG